MTIRKSAGHVPTTIKLRSVRPVKTSGDSENTVAAHIADVLDEGSDCVVDFSADVEKSSAGHGRCGSGGCTSVTVAFCLLKYSRMLRRNNCDRVKSRLAQIESTVASMVFGSRNPVDGSDSFNVRPPPCG